tara:strand:- start:162 stop:563 length:402 start_codon:yes stop_codon:yes gene_type:complete
MKYFKHLLFLSILCPLVLFTNCTWDNFFWVVEKTMPDGLNIETIECHCGEVLEFIPESLTAGDDSMNCRDKRGVDVNLEGFPYFRVKNYCSDSVLNVCSYGEERDKLTGDLIDTRLGLVDSTQWCNVHDYQPW